MGISVWESTGRNYTEWPILIPAVMTDTSQTNKPGICIKIWRLVLNEAAAEMSYQQETCTETATGNTQGYSPSSVPFLFLLSQEEYRQT